MKSTRKMLALVLALVMCLAFFPASASAAGIIASGAAGPNSEFVLYGDGRMIINGTGQVNPNNQWSFSTWPTGYTSAQDAIRATRSMVKTLEVGQGITTLSNQAFSDIEAAIIAKLGFSDIEMTDGITEMTQTVDKSGLTTTDGSFTYWKKAKDATGFAEWDPSSEGAQNAEYDEESGAVKWDMGTNFMPEDGATYKVTWKVWPSQDAYDILAKCKNDPSFYDTLTDAQKAQITRTGTSPRSPCCNEIRLWNNYRRR